MLLVGLNTGGTACPMQYVFITVMPDGTGKATKEFGTCSDLITVSQKDDKITVTMPKLRGKGKETYIYKDGDLVKGNKTKKK